MENTCLNCNHLITENFCTYCGQKKYKRIDRKYLTDEVQYMVIHTNKGFFYSLKNIIKAPGKTARDFIDGNRVNHYKPLLMAFVLSGISAFISFKIIDMNSVMERYFAAHTEQKIAVSWMNDLTSVMSSYSSALMLLLIPIVSIVTVLVFRKWGQNYYEHIIMNTYIQILYTIISIVLLSPIMYFLKDSPDTFMLVVIGSTFIIYPIIMTWFYKQFYSQKSISDVIIKVLLLMAVGIILYLGLIFAVAIYMIITNPAMFQQMQPK
ncbi:DUF3667 domain-containing protein [Flavobacterium sp. WW92]|uniref:DUF3667 domain-containing protein n=1 Tax=unclassified Flavobacterium TaxID=196869 RepID=UPI0022252026|nr:MULTISPECIES: DUF3667 domain-containing protein [unclassified Flavobacterium]WDO12917.1 DUF3667 domain-containing protein [Flavobacterium sp. WW92]